MYNFSGRGNRSESPPSYSSRTATDLFSTRKMKNTPLTAALAMQTSDSTSSSLEVNLKSDKIEDELSRARRIAMRIILVLRAVPWAAYIYTAADVSCVFVGDLGDEIVQIL
jgi:hypothetical protein